MFVNSLSTVGIANQVWAQAARTLTNPSGVWSDATRTVTSMGTGALSVTGAVSQSLAGAASFNIQPASGSVFDFTVSVQSGVGSTSGVNIEHSDGSTVNILATVGAGAVSGGTSMVVINSAYCTLANADATHTAKYNYSGARWIQ